MDTQYWDDYKEDDNTPDRRPESDRLLFAVNLIFVLEAFLLAITLDGAGEDVGVGEPDVAASGPGGGDVSVVEDVRALEIFQHPRTFARRGILVRSVGA